MAEPAGGPSTARGVLLDSFTGATDDAKLTQALSYVSQQTCKPAIVLGQRSMEFKQPRQVFDGLAFTGLISGNEFHYNQRVRISVPGSGWLTLPKGRTRGLYVGNLSFEGDSGTAFFADQGSGGPVLWASHFENLAFNLFKHVMWGAHNAVTFSGFWDVNNSYDTPFKLWGSDNSYWTDGMLIDSPRMGHGDRYHVWLPNVSKTVVGPIFATARANVCALRLDGGRGVVLNGARFDAQAQAGHPTLGSQLLITGGRFVRVRDCWFYGGMSDPGSAGHSHPAYDKGIVTVTGGAGIVLDGLMFSDGDGVQPDATRPGTPHVHIGGGSGIRIRDIQASGAPIVRRASSVPAATIVTDPDVPVSVG